VELIDTKAAVDEAAVKLDPISQERVAQFLDGLKSIAHDSLVGRTVTVTLEGGSLKFTIG
jgi:hypothetical protein